MCVAGVALAAIVMGLPTLRGGFVGGDDHRLVIDHVLVNRPSLTHAFQLFTIVHRDLYQPLPLLMFSGEMVVAQSLNLFASGSQGGAWLFHLSNVVLHALVAVLVWFTIRMLHMRSPDPRDWQLNLASRQSAAIIIATAAALIFAVHPFNVETVAWVNGRMMLLSTLFGLAGVLSFARWLDRPGTLDAVLTVLFMVLSAISKVRVGLPLLLLLVAMMRGDLRRGRFWPVWLVAGGLTAFFAWVNIDATSQADLFSEAAEHLLGPRAVRVLLALDFYITHVFWPAGLASYYPTPPVVAWSDPETIRAALVVGLSGFALTVACWRVSAARWGMAWFLIALADTLPFVPARNVLAADRYMYLPLVGLLWALAAIGERLYSHWRQHTVRSRAPAVVSSAAAASVLPLLIAMSWHTAKWYNTPELKTERVALLFPDVPRVWERLGWTSYSNGDYERAIELAHREFVHEIPAVKSGAHQLIGMSRFRQGRTDEAIAELTKALEIDPQNDLGRFRLGMVYEELGRFPEALPLFEACVRSASSHNPTLHRLARVYRELGRNSDARAMYEQELKNNPYEVSASIALADLDFREGNAAGSKQRLLELLAWMPENASARFNLALLYESTGRLKEAAEQFSIAAGFGMETMEQAVLAHDFFERIDDSGAAISLWESYLSSHPADAAARAYLAWSYFAAGNTVESRRQIAMIGPAARDLSMAQATVALFALDDGRDDMVRFMAERLVASGDAPTRKRLLRALERYDARKPGVAWTYYLTSALLRADGQPEAAEAFLELFTKNCATPACNDARRLLDEHGSDGG